MDPVQVLELAAGDVGAAARNGSGSFLRDPSHDDPMMFPMPFSHRT